MTKLQRMTDEINSEDGLGVLLMAQMDSVPDTLQFVVATTEYDAEADGLRDKSRYVVRAVGVQEHRVSVGMFNQFQVRDDHPLLYELNQNPVGVFFRGQPDDANGLLVDLLQAYATTFGPWRNLPDYINTEQPLHTLLTSGGGLLGQMPKALAGNVEKVLQSHSLETNLLEGEREKDRPPMKALLLDDSYIVAMDFSADELGKA